MAADNDNQTLNALPRRITRRHDTAATQCDRCGEALTAHPGDVVRCLCARTELRNPIAGGLGASVVLHPPRPYRGWRRG